MPEHLNSNHSLSAQWNLNKPTTMPLSSDRRLLLRDWKDTEKDELTKTLDYCVYCFKHSYVPVETFCGLWSPVSSIERARIRSDSPGVQVISRHLGFLRVLLEVTPSCIETLATLWGMVCAEGEKEPLSLLLICNTSEVNNFSVRLKFNVGY